MESAAAPDFQLPQKPGTPKSLAAAEVVMDRMSALGELILFPMEWHQERWWFLPLVFALLFVGALLGEAGGILAVLGWVMAFIGMGGLTFGLALPLTLIVLWIPVVLLLMLVGYPLLFLLTALYHQVRPPARVLRMWMTPMGVTVEGHARIGKRSQGCTRQHFPLLTARHQAALQQEGKASTWSLSLRDGEGQVWSFSKLTLTDTEASALQDALHRAHAATVERQGEGRREVPMTLEGLQQV